MLTQYDVLPTDFVLTQIEIPETVGVRVVEDQDLPVDWQSEPPSQMEMPLIQMEDVVAARIAKVSEARVAAIVAGESAAQIALLDDQMIALRRGLEQSLSKAQLLGLLWAQEQSSGVLSVPSALMGTDWPTERNDVINPQHIGFASIKFGDPKPFRFDPRLK